MVKPRNYLLLACHFSNEAVQLTQLGRKIRYEYFGGKERKYVTAFYSFVLFICLFCLLLLTNTREGLAAALPESTERK